MINGHAHIDHAGAFAYLKQRAPQAVLAVMKDDVAAMESGDRSDFKYADDFVYEGVEGRPRLQRRRHDQDGRGIAHRVPHPGPYARRDRMGASRGHGLASRTSCTFPTGFNPGYRLAKDPIYPGVNDGKTAYTLTLNGVPVDAQRQGLLQEESTERLLAQQRDGEAESRWLCSPCASVAVTQRPVHCLMSIRRMELHRPPQIGRERVGCLNGTWKVPGAGEVLTR